MAIFKKNVTNHDVRDNLVDWIRKGIEFSTPIRNTGMMTTKGYVGGLRTASISGHVEEDSMQNPVYVVYSYNTPIMWVTMGYGNNDNYVPVSAKFDNRKYSATTNTMQGYCYSALMDLFDVTYMPDVIGKRGGRKPRRNYTSIERDEDNDFMWVCLDAETGELTLIGQFGDSYNGDTEGSFFSGSYY